VHELHWPVLKGIETMLTLFGASAVAVMMGCYALEERQRGYTLAFALACAAASAYGWLAGTWPFGVVEAIWAVIAFRKWWFRARRTVG
jgi:hypothetical protein